MNETRVTIHGNVVTEPVVRETRTGGVFTTFRIATTPFSRTADGKFVDGETSFYGVIAFNALGANIGASLRKGQPVVVEGKLSTREWQGADGQLRQSTEIDAEHVGHDLTWGRSRFERLSKAAALGHDRLSEPERQAVLAVANSDEFGHLAPSQIVPRLADRGEYIASESTFYRVLRAAKQLGHRSAPASRSMGDDPRVASTIIAAGLVGGISSPILLAPAVVHLGDRGFFWVIAGVSAAVAVAGLIARQRLPALR